MADGHGGYRRPAHPAPASGPGAQSQRTDGGPADRQAMRDLPDAKYGEQKANREIQAGAAMSAGAPSPAPAPADLRAGIVPLSAPTQRPDEPVTAGNPLGAGYGPEGAGIDPRPLEARDAHALAGLLPLLEFMANQPGAAPSSRVLVRQIRANL